MILAVAFAAAGQGDAPASRGAAPAAPTAPRDSVDAPADEVDVRAFGATGGGRSDDTAALQAAVDFAASARRTVVFPPGTYLVDAASNSTDPKKGGIVVPSHSTIVLRRGAVLKVIPNGAWGYQALLVRNVDDVRITGGGSIRCDRAEHDYRDAPKGRGTHEWGYGIAVIGSRDVVMQELTIEGCTGDDILVGPTGVIPRGDYVPSERVRIVGNRLDGARRNNLSITGCDGVQVEGNVITRAGWNDGVHDGTAPRFGVDIEGYGENGVRWETALNVIVRGNLLRDNLGASIGNFNGFGVVIESNIADGYIGYGYGAETIVSGNVIKENPGRPMRCGITGIGVTQARGTSNSVIVANTIVGFETGIDVRGRDLVVASNSVYKARQKGILAYTVANARIDGNVVVEAPLGISVDPTASYVTISDNTVTRSTTAIQSGGKQTGIRANRIDDANVAVRVVGGPASIEDNAIDASGLWATSYAIALGGADLVASVKGNTFRGLKNTAIIGSGSTLRIVANRVEGFEPAVAAMSFSKIGRIEVLDNTIGLARVSDGAAAITVSETIGALVVGNRILSENGRALGHPIQTDHATASKVLNNQTSGGTLVTHPTDMVQGNLSF